MVIGPGTVGTTWAQAGCVAAPCQPCASHGGEQGGPELGGWRFGPRAALWDGAAAACLLPACCPMAQLIPSPLGRQRARDRAGGDLHQVGRGGEAQSLHPLGVGAAGM